MNYIALRIDIIQTLHFIQSHVVLLNFSFSDTFTQVSVWYQSLQEEHSIQLELVTAGMRHIQNTDINSVRLTKLTPRRIFLTGKIDMLCSSKHLIKCNLILSWSKKNSPGCRLNTNAVANAILKMPQSADPD